MPNRSTNLALAILCGLALLASVLLPVQLPELQVCGFRRLTGYPCPFCGMTHAYTAMGHGQWGAALRQNPAGTVFYVATFAVFAVCLVGLFRPVQVRLNGKALLIAGTGVLLLSWVYKLVTW